MHYISHIIERLLLPMTLKRNFLIFTIISFISACTSTPFTELNSRDNFQLEEKTSFKIQLNKESLPVEMDPILIENLGDAAKEYLEGVGHQSSQDASMIVDVSVTTKDMMIFVFTAIQCIEIICMSQKESTLFQSSFYEYLLGMKI